MLKKGYTLIEISIVMMIIGLIVGVVLGAKEIRDHVILMRVINEFQFFDKIYQIFYDKYGYLPGDMPNASSFWSGANNGTGDGKITTTGQDFYMEATNEWSHLHNSGIYPNVNTGLPVGAQSNNIPPKSSYPYSDIGVYVFSTGNLGINSSRNSIQMSQRIAWDRNVSPVVPGKFAYNIDRKIDDGVPATGNFIVEDTSGTNACYSGSSYNMSSTSVSCIMYYFLSAG